MTKISGLPVDTSPTLTDSVPTLDAETITSKRVTLQSIFNLIVASFAGASSNINSSNIDWSASTGKVWWQELGRASGTGSSLAVSFTAKAHLLVLAYVVPSTTMDLYLRFNGDTGTNYDYRYETNGAADVTGINQTVALVSSSFAGRNYLQIDLINILAEYKSGYVRSNGYAPGIAPGKRTATFGWNNTSAQIGGITMLPSTGTFVSPTEIIFLGHD